MSEPTVLGVEIKHAVYCMSGDEDCVVAKINNHMSDGTIVPGMMHKKNFVRKFYITKPSKRNHKQKKAREHIDNLIEYKCRHMDMKNKVARELGFKNGFQGQAKMLYRNPYVYGTDHTPPVLLKHYYKNKFPNAISNNTIAVLDIETDVVHGTGEPILCSITSGDRAFIGYTADYAKGFDNPVKDFKAAIDLYVDKYIKDRNIKIEFYEGKNAGDICQAAIRKHHDWMVDFVVIWNIAFDVPKMLDALEKYGYDAAEVFSHPSVEPKFRKAKWRPGKDEKVKFNSSTGKMGVHKISPEERWHVLDTPSNAAWLDGMCVYYQLRKASGKENEYNLDYVLNKHLKISKLKIKGLEHLDQLPWHIEAQKHHKAAYLAYNLFDDISVELLFDKLGDFTSTISVLIESSEYYRFDSQTRMISDDLQFVYQDNGYICCAISDEMEDELDKHVCSKDGWISTLASHLCHDNGVRFFSNDNTSSEIRIWVFDVDAVSTYPSEEIAFNISQETTRIEFNRMQGLTEEEQRIVGINLTGGANNAAEILSFAYGMPAFEEVLNIFKQEHQIH